MSYAGVYNLKNPKKYMGIGTVPHYKSRNELIVFSRMDTDPNILRWGYEIFEIPYLNPIDGKVHKYKMDIYCESLKSGTVIKCLIEIKQSTDMVPPTRPTLMKPRSKERYKLASRTYVVNSSKWRAAIELAKKLGLKLIFLTEKDIAKM